MLGTGLVRRAMLSPWRRLVGPLLRSLRLFQDDARCEHRSDCGCGEPVESHIRTPSLEPAVTPFVGLTIVSPACSGQEPVPAGTICRSAILGGASRSAAAKHAAPAQLLADAVGKELVAAGRPIIKTRVRRAVEAIVPGRIAPGIDPGELRGFE